MIRQTTNSKPDLSALPNTFAITLDNMSAISLSGEDKTKYLQGQVTCDVTKLTDSNWMYGAHCNAKGKMYSCFRVTEWQDSYLLIQPTTTMDASLAELKKFGVFAKVEISPTSDISYVALIGDLTKQLASQFPSLGSKAGEAVSANGIKLLTVDAKSHTLIAIGESAKLQSLIEQLSIEVYPADVWNLLEIQNGIPFIVDTSHEYVPQMLNMQAIGGISFTKGCYLGQETVARMQYLGKNKKAMFALEGAGNIAATLEKQLGENWRKAGDVTSVYQSDDGKVYVQAVLANDTTNEINIRFKEDIDSKLTLTPLPYALSDETSK